MSRTRVFVPWSFDRLRDLVGDGRVGDHAVLLPPRTETHGVTDELRAEFRDADEEELEYLAMTAAAQRSVPLVAPDGPYRRIVLAVDVDSAQPMGAEDPTRVLAGGQVLLRDLVSVHVDSEDAAPDVWAARSTVVGGAVDAHDRLTRCLDHELGWYAVTELDEVVGRAAEDHWRPGP